MPKSRRVTEPTNERWQAFMAGELTVHEMDDDELARGTFRAKDGTFRGRPPKTVPRDFATQLSRELMSRADSRFRDRLLMAIDVVAEVAETGEKDSDRVRAAAMIIDRLMGKVPERVLVSQGKPEWETEVEKFLAGVEDEQIGRAQTILGRGGT